MNKIRGTTFNGARASRQSQVVGGGVTETQPVFFNGKCVKISFWGFCEQILAMFVLFAIYLDKRRVDFHTYFSHVSTNFSHENGKKPRFDDF